MKKIPVLAVLVILGFTMIPLIQASEDTEIIVSIVGEPILDLDLENRLVRAYVEVINFDPSGDGYYYMQVIQPGTDKILTEKEILLQNKGNDIWGAEIAGMVDDDKISQNGKPVLGDYKINIFTEFGSSTASTTFSIIKSSEAQPNIIEEIEKPSPDVLEENQTSTIQTENELEEESIEDLELNSNGTDELKIPEWVKNIALWYGQGTVSEDEFLNAIKFLISEGIITV